MNKEGVKPAAVGLVATAAAAIEHSGHSAHAPLSKTALGVLLIGAFLAPLDYFIVNLALPAIHTGLDATNAQLQLIVSAYASAYAVLLITGGRLGDLFGRRRMFMAGMAGIMALASAMMAARFLHRE